MASSNNKAVSITRNRTEGEVEVKLVAKFLLSILSLAIKKVGAATNTTDLCVSSASQLFVR